MSKGELIDEHVSVDQCKLAVEALHSHETKKQQKLHENELLPGKEQNVWLVLTVKKMPAERKFKPAKIPITHPLIDPRTTPICLLTKDPQRQYKDLLESHGIKFISRVVGLSKLKGKFKPFEARRMLLKENGMFLTDERIVPLLPKLLGVKWFEAKKQPIPVCLTRKDLKGELERAISSTYMNQNQGTCTSIKIGTLSQTPAQVLANIKVGLPAVIKHVKGGWDNVQSFSIKTNSSASLPIWTCALDESEGGRWNGLTVNEKMEGSENEDSEMAVDDEKITEKTLTKKGKRSSEELNVSEKPNKKAKGPEGKPVETPFAEKMTRIDSAVKSKKRKASPAIDASASPSDSPVLPPKIGVATKPSTAAITSPRKVDAAESTPSQKKSRKSKAAETLTLPSATTASPEKPDPDTQAPPESSSNPKKKKKSRASEIEPSAAPRIIPAVIEASSEAPKKKKKSRVSAVEPPADPVTTQPIVDESPAIVTPPSSNDPPRTKKPRHKAAAKAALKDGISTKDISQGADTSTDIPPRAYSPSIPLPSADTEPTSITKGKPKEKKANGADKSTPPAASISNEELVQKRSARSGEKKKEKVVKAKGGKSAKHAVLGKKVAQG